MSWNAASAAQAEIIEFLEELVDLTKLLVGANEFRSGLLTRPTFREYVGGGGKEGDEASGEGRDEVGDAALGNVLSPKQTRETTHNGKAAAEGLTRRRRGTTASSKAVEDDVPASLRRIQSRKMEAGLKKQRTNESWNQ